MKRLVVFGDRTAEEVMEAANIACRNMYDSIDKIYFEEESSLADQTSFDVSVSAVHYIVGTADFRIKSKIVSACTGINWSPVSVVHPSAVVSASAAIGAGVFIAPMAVVSSAAIVGDHSIVHIHSGIGHDATVGRFCTVLPGARVSGNVTIGDKSLIGSNAFVGAGVTVGDDCRVDALTYVRHDLPTGHLMSQRTKMPVKRIDLQPS